MTTPKSHVLGMPLKKRELSIADLALASEPKKCDLKCYEKLESRIAVMEAELARLLDMDAHEMDEEEADDEEGTDEIDWKEEEH